MFQIQTGYPNIVPSNISGINRLAEIFPNLFQKEQEAFYLFWNHIPIRFRYGEDLEQNFSSIFEMLCNLKDKTEGYAQLLLNNEILKIRIDMHWTKEHLILDIQADTDHFLYKTYGRELTKKKPLNVHKKRFMAEWHTLIHQLVLFLYAGKIHLENDKEQQKLELLRELDKQLEGYGSLYEGINL